MKRFSVTFIASVVVTVVSLAALAACASDAPPAPESDSAQSFAAGSVIPVDDNVYVISGVVVGDVESLTRQTDPGGGSISGINGVVSGSFFGPQFGGKGFVRLKVFSAQPPTDLAPAEQIVIIKTSDTKASVLLPGDRVTFKCRAQYEALAAVRDRETFDAGKVATWELDYCRLSSPVIQVLP